LISRTIIRGGDKQIPRQHSPQLLRSHRSKYQPHVGRKQLVKQAVAGKRNAFA